MTSLPQVRTQVQVPLRHSGATVVADVFTFSGLVDEREHLLLALGDWQGALQRAGLGAAAPLVRLHSECLTGDVFASERCDCGPQLAEAIGRIAAVGGFLLYLRQEGRGIGLYAKFDAYVLQDAGLDTYEANVALGHGKDERDYTVAAQMLAAVGATRIALLTNNPDKVRQLADLGIDVVDQVPTGVHLTTANARYLAAKAARSSHTIVLPEQADEPSDAPPDHRPTTEPTTEPTGS
jgi:GTP cyclohydrolase II